MGTSGSRHPKVVTLEKWPGDSWLPSLISRHAVLRGVRVEDSGGPKGKMLVLDADAREGQVICRDAGLWVMHEDVDFNVHLTPDGRSKFQYHKGSQTVVDGFFALTRLDQERILEFYCPPVASTALRKRFGSSGERVGQLLKTPAGVSEAEVWRALQIFQRNAQATQLANGKFIVAMYPILSRICHSCAPNINYRVVGDGFLEVTSKQNLVAGDELVQSYLTNAELAWPTARRQEKTLRVWGFTCDCPRCKL